MADPLSIFRAKGCTMFFLNVGVRRMRTARIHPLELLLLLLLSTRLHHVACRPHIAPTGSHARSRPHARWEARVPSQRLRCLEKTKLQSLKCRCVGATFLTPA